MRIMEYLSRLNVLQQYLDGGDYTDVKVVEGDTNLRRFIAAMLSHYPWWIVLLYRIRALLVHILGLVKHEAPQELPDLDPKEIDFTPGKRVTFFIVRCAKEDHYWFSETPEDKHLKAYFGVVAEPLDSNTKRFYVITVVHYKHWTGPVYFNLIRPFHHLVVSRMARAGIKGKK